MSCRFVGALRPVLFSIVIAGVAGPRTARGQAAPGGAPNAIDVKTKTSSDAKNTLDKLGIKSVFNYVDDQHPKDTVHTQDINDGIGVTAGMTITMTVSNGPALVVIPELRISDIGLIDVTRFEKTELFA